MYKGNTLIFPSSVPCPTPYPSFCLFPFYKGVIEFYKNSVYFREPWNIKVGRDFRHQVQFYSFIDKKIENQIHWNLSKSYTILRPQLSFSRSQDGSFSSRNERFKEKRKGNAERQSAKTGLSLGILFLINQEWEIWLHLAARRLRRLL